MAPVSLGLGRRSAPTAAGGGGDSRWAGLDIDALHASGEVALLRAAEEVGPYPGA